MNWRKLVFDLFLFKIFTRCFKLQLFFLFFLFLVFLNYFSLLLQPFLIRLTKFVPIFYIYLVLSFIRFINWSFYRRFWNIYRFSTLGCSTRFFWWRGNWLSRCRRNKSLPNFNLLLDLNILCFGQLLGIYKRFFLIVIKEVSWFIDTISILFLCGICIKISCLICKRAFMAKTLFLINICVCFTFYLLFLLWHLLCFLWRGVIST